MNKVIILTISTFIISLIYCKEVITDNLTIFNNEITSITIYDGNYPSDSPDTLTQANFNIDLFKELLPHIKYDNKNAIWKGGSTSIIKFNNGIKKYLRISYYGGFFKIIGDEGIYYFEAPADDKFIKAYSEIVQNIFIPKRIEKLNKINK